MKKLHWIVLFLSVSGFTLAQERHQLLFSINTPILYQNSEPIRMIGIEAGYLRSFKLNEYLAFEIGITMDAYARNNYIIKTYNWTTYQQYTYSNDFLHIGLDIPLLLNYNLGKFEIKNGVDLGLKNLIVYTKYPPLDPESGYVVISPQPYFEESHRFLGLSYQGNISYNTNGRFCPFIDFKSLLMGLNIKYNKPNYSLLGVGLIYRIGVD